MNKRQVRQVRQVNVGFVISFVLSAQAEVLVGKAVGVSDCDTITVPDTTKTEQKLD